MKDELALRMRLQGGAVKRYHTFPTIGTQTVAEHSFRVAAILKYIDPIAPDLQSALDHDVAEHVTGDLPYHMKQANRDIGAAMQEYETKVLGDNGVEVRHSVNLKVADLLEMGYFAMDQMVLGNSAAWRILHNVQIALDNMLLTPKAENLYEELFHDTGE